MCVWALQVLAVVVGPEALRAVTQATPLQRASSWAARESRCMHAPGDHRTHSPTACQPLHVHLCAPFGFNPGSRGAAQPGAPNGCPAVRSALRHERRVRVYRQKTLSTRGGGPKGHSTCRATTAAAARPTHPRPPASRPAAASAPSAASCAASSTLRALQAGCRGAGGGGPSGAPRPPKHHRSERFEAGLAGIISIIYKPIASE